jgi:hypothetical protein
MSTYKKESSKPTKYYFLSILCLIPFFGTIVGIVLVFISFFRFRNPRMTGVIMLMTIIGVILEFIFFRKMENEIKYGNETGQQFSIFAADNLDTIAIKLQLYKNNHGEFPENLEGLKKDYPNLLIIDPLLSRNSEVHKFLNYYYFKKDSSYTLFSSGIDGIPNTKDDIYPRKPPKLAQACN